MFQKIIIVGYLGSDPEMRYMPDGTAVTNFSVATSRRWTDSQSGQPVDETTWFRVNTWGKQAENANQYLRRGSKALVEGRIVPDPQTGGPKLYTRRDGTVGASFEIRATQVTFLDSKEEREKTSTAAASTSPASAPIEEDDIPF